MILFECVLSKSVTAILHFELPYFYHLRKICHIVSLRCSILPESAFNFDPLHYLLTWQSLICKSICLVSVRPHRACTPWRFCVELLLIGSWTGASCICRQLQATGIRSVLLSGQGVCSLTKITGGASLQLIFITRSASIILLYVRWAFTAGP